MEGVLPYRQHNGSIMVFVFERREQLRTVNFALFVHTRFEKDIHEHDRLDVD